MAKESLTVLAIDDDKATRQGISQYLTDKKYKIIEAESGEEGLSLFSEYGPDLVLCDINMQNKKGVDLLSILTEESPHTPFVVLSSASVIHDAVEALRKGAWDYLIKPISDMGALSHAINKSLERCELLRENERYKNRLETANEELSKNLAELEEDQEAGRCVQFQLLPEKEQKIGSFSLDHYIMPSLYLSGDFVDYFPIDDHTMGFYIADVSGHGAPSAFITVLLKSLVNHFVVRYGAHTNDMIINPAKLFNWLSLDILRAKLGKYLTMIYGVIDEKANTLTYAVGGHFPNPVVIVDNEAKYLEGSGFPIGVFDKAEYENHTIDLPEKFNIIMLSDGILELLPHDNLEAKEAYLLSLLSDDNININKITSAVEMEKYKSIPDDITILHLKRD